MTALGMYLMCESQLVADDVQIGDQGLACLPAIPRSERSSFPMSVSAMGWMGVRIESRDMILLQGSDVPHYDNPFNQPPMHLPSHTLPSAMTW